MMREGVGHCDKSKCVCECIKPVWTDEIGGNACLSAPGEWFVKVGKMLASFGIPSTVNRSWVLDRTSR